ncbi:MAG: hypothetical protein F4Y50_14385 [Dehalococcoidia bacterium]|nr:hypothetical protein [Dehalococcoidia bacterium]
MWNQVKTVYSRVLGVLRLDPQAFAEIHADPGATYQAVVVVFISSLAVAHRAPGALLTTILIPFGFIVWWIVAAVIIHWLGTTFFSTKDTPPTAFAPLARGIGFAMAPRIFQIFLAPELIRLPDPLWLLVLFLTTVWMFAAMTLSTHIAFGRISYNRVTLIIAITMLPMIVLEPFIHFVGR